MPHTARESRPAQSARSGRSPPPLPADDTPGVDFDLPSIFTQRRNAPDRRFLATERMKHSMLFTQENLCEICIERNVSENKLREAAHRLNKIAEMCAREAGCLEAEQKRGLFLKALERLKAAFTGGNSRAGGHA